MLPPIQIPLPITTSFVESHLDYAFVYSDTRNEPSCFGQSGVINWITHVNAYRIPVRWSLCKSSGYMSDNQLDEIKLTIDKFIQKIPDDKPIIPFPKMGCGASRMRELAPKAWAYMMEQLEFIKYKNIIYIPKETGFRNEHIINPFQL